MPFVERLSAAAAPPRLIEEFVGQYLRYADGESGKLRWSEIAPPGAGDIVDLAMVADAAALAHGAAVLGSLVCIKLNGGLGTTMKLSRAKTLIPVREGRTFLDLIAEQLRRLRARHGVQTPLLLMNSFHTEADTLAALGAFPQPSGVPLSFLQHKVPRIDARSGGPLDVADDEQNWAPPGHADVYLALWLSGLLEHLVAQGYRWAFVSNADNLAATVAPEILGFLDAAGFEFAMEVTDKTPADIKGGTLVRHRGRLALLERAQVEPEHVADFEDTRTLAVFNTNSLWWRLDAMLARLRAGNLGLPLIVNPKRVADRDVVQLETAMGAAISCFDRAVGLRVPRSRFAPVKGTADLVGVRSDAYAVDELGGLRLSSQRTALLGPPLIELDPRCFGGLADLEQRCPHPLGLLRCRSLAVRGDLRFGRDVTIVGDVTLSGADAGPRPIPDGACFADGAFAI
jgi:UTP--glucose-1-phosphate uridylyltransferase